MRRLTIFALVGLLAGAGLVALLEQGPGYVFVSVAGVSVETSFWFAVLFWLLLWGALALMASVAGRILRTRSAVSGWFGGRKSRNAAALTNRGLINFIEGNWLRARKQLLRAAKYSEAPLINHLVAAQASFNLKDIDEMRRQLGAAESVESDAGVALELTQAELHLSAGENEQALATLVRARANASKHPQVLELLARAHRRLGDWHALKELLPELRKSGLLESPRLVGLEGQMWVALLDEACTDQSDRALDKLWQTIPLDQREGESLRVRYIACLINYESWASAERHLISMLDKRWSVGLVRLLGTFPPENPKKLRKAVDRWLELYGQDATLLLASGRVALFAEDWTLAQQHFEAAHSVKPSIDNCLELARLFAALGFVDRETEFLRQAALLKGATVTRAPLPAPEQRQLA